VDITLVNEWETRWEFFVKPDPAEADKRFRIRLVPKDGTNTQEWATTMGFDGGDTFNQNWRTVINATRQTFLITLKLTEGQYDYQTIIPVLESEMKTAAADQGIDTPEFAVTTPDEALYGDTKYLITMTGATGEFVIYDNGHDSPLANLLGFVDTNTNKGYLNSTDYTAVGSSIAATKTQDLTGTKMFYLESDLAGRNYGIQGDGRICSMVAAIPVNACFSENCIRTWNKDQPTLMFPEPRTVTTISFTLYDENYREVDPGGVPLVVTMQLVPWQRC
jgi:hypothetical protein